MNKKVSLQPFFSNFSKNIAYIQFYFFHYQESVLEATSRALQARPISDQEGSTTLSGHCWFHIWILFPGSTYDGLGKMRKTRSLGRDKLSPEFLADILGEAEIKHPFSLNLQ